MRLYLTYHGGRTIASGEYVRHLECGRIEVKDEHGQTYIGHPVNPDEAAIARNLAFYAEEYPERADCDFSELPKPKKQETAAPSEPETADNAGDGRCNSAMPCASPATNTGPAPVASQVSERAGGYPPQPLAPKGNNFEAISPSELRRYGRGLMDAGIIPTGDVVQLHPGGGMMR
jgi:hypothetical protein